jgi:hypothetical protein
LLSVTCIILATRLCHSVNFFSHQSPFEGHIYRSSLQNLGYRCLPFAHHIVQVWISGFKCLVSQPLVFPKPDLSSII